MPASNPTSTALPELDAFWGGLVRLLQLPEMADPRGRLVAFDDGALPFAPKRVFVVHSAPVGSVRGQHAHVRGQQVLCCLAGALAVALRHRGEERSVMLASPRQALVIGAPVWSSQRYMEPGTLLLVMASEPYDPAGYVDDGA